MRTYTCTAVWAAHCFQGNDNPDRVPQSWGEFCCEDCLPMVQKCRADKGLELLIVYPDSYPEDDKNG